MLHPKQARLGVFLNYLFIVQKNCKQCHETEKTEKKCHHERSTAGQDRTEA